MPEPSVLDYLKAVLSFGRLEVPKIPPLSQRGARVQEVSPQPAAKSRSVALEARNPIHLPWRSTVALALMLVAQVQWTTPGSSWLQGLVAALAAVTFVVWAWIEGEWRIPQLETAAVEQGSLVFRRAPLAAGLLLFALTFLLTGENRFTFLNLFCWFGSIVLVIFAFGQFDPKESWRRTREKLSQGNWGLKFSSWTLVLLAAFAVIAYFRFTNLGSLPAEMVSEQAENLQDLNDIDAGQYPIFFERNGGRELLLFYTADVVAGLFGTGASFLTLKLATGLLSFLLLVYVYQLGKEIGGRWVGLFALLLVGVGYWPTILARLGLNYSFYPALAAPTLYYLLSGLRRGNLNSLLLAGVFMGIGLNAYSAFRVMPLVALAALGLFLLHTPSRELRRRGLIGFALLALVTLVVCTPLLRYAIGHPDLIGHRVASRLLQGERAYPGNVGWIALQNLWNGLKMFNASGGNIWLVGLGKTPAFDPVSAVLLLLGAIVAAFRYIRSRSWVDLFLLLSIPLMMLPSTMALAFPEENPAMHHASGALLPAFLLAAFALDAFLHGWREHLEGRVGWAVAYAGGVIALVIIAATNYSLYFGDYIDNYDESAWNTSELGAVIADFSGSFGDRDSAWVVVYPYWVDTRLVAVNAGYPEHDYALWPDNLADSLQTQPPKLFLLHPQDADALAALKDLYPTGLVGYHQSRVPGKEFVTYFVPDQANQ